ncbi:hypothetical protein [Streptomyces sp. NPDC102462]|uniref:hypothetical protein n=1 Tax=Streptomyces sp. NPDC102462 TaxID=3366178 RepID=UPI00381A2B3A
MCSVVRRISAAKSVGPKAPPMSRVRVAGLFGVVFTTPVTDVAAGWGRAPPSRRPRRLKNIAAEKRRLRARHERPRTGRRLK